ncbi:MAG: carboxypeptidase regulatory-like domain-containing protein, partial [Syntrophaceticus schinkii]|nr:carboxypeptidase regulatory-like domain-containing protein [Syntrophaceticus schinkii]
IRFAEGEMFVKSVHSAASDISITPDRLTRGNNPRSMNNQSLATSARSTSNRSTNRALVGYKVWRLAAGQEANEASWVLLTDDVISTLNTVDDDWATLVNGTYKWAVKAVYSSDVLSVAALSNPLVKEVLNGTIVGFVRRQNQQGIAGATVTVPGGYSATTNTAGAYSLVVPVGVYSVTATANGFTPFTYDNITVSPSQNTTVNFVMSPVSNEDEVIPVTATMLKGNYPNPFNPETTISYDIKDPASVRLNVYNLKGQLVRSLVNEDQNAGRYRVVFDGRDEKGNPLASGIYLYRFTAGDYSHTRKMMLME